MAIVIVAVFACGAVDAQQSVVPTPQLGWLIDPASREALPELPPVSMPQGRPGPWVLLDAEWAQVEQEVGAPDWARHRSMALALNASGYRVGLVLRGGHPQHLPDGGLPRVEVEGSLDAWQQFARSAVRDLGGALGMVQIGDRLPSAEQADRYNFMLKNVALALGAEAERAEIELIVAQAGLTPDRLAAQERLWERGAAAYVDVLPVVLPGDADGRGVAFVDQVLQQTLLHPPASRVWLQVETRSGASDSAAPIVALRGLTAGVHQALIRQSIGVEDFAAKAAWLSRAHALLAEGYAPAPLGELRVEDSGGAVVPGAQAVARFFSDDDFSSLIFYVLPGERRSLPEDRLLVDTSFVRETRLRDFVQNQTLRTTSAPRADGAKGRAIRIHRGPLPLAVQFLQAPVSDQFELPPEEIRTTGTRELTAEEIIARHQQVARNQDDQLKRWIARGRVDFHLMLANAGGTVDISIESNYFWERGKQLEWEQTDYYVNGNKITWKNIPELPFLQPEKVLTLPLDLTLDKTYAYRNAGRDRVEDRDAYVLRFRPSDPDAPQSLYRGRIWIDTEDFSLLKTSVVQTGLESPVLSNEEIDIFADREDADGRSFRLLDRIDGQQTWNAAGRAFVVQREVYFTHYEINPAPADFERRRDTAYASTNQMLRDTDEGFRYLERTEDGSRVIKESLDTSQLFAAAGVLGDSANDTTPLAGVNYFNYDLWGKNIQTNVFFAGAFLFGTISKPDLFGGRADATVDVVGLAIRGEDNFFSGSTELDTEAVEQRPQSMRFRLGFPIQEFVKLNLIGGLRYLEYSDADTSNDAIAAFNASPDNPGQQLRYILPENHLQTSGEVQLQFNRKGWSINAEAEVVSRSDWETFGLFDDVAGAFVRRDTAGGGFAPIEPETVFDEFSTWGVSVFKEWYLPSFQKFRIAGNYLDGSDLDRFSRYQFSFFGDDRLWGFSGSGVRFDQGTIARAGWSFNLFEAIRLDVAVDHAWVENELDLAGRQQHSGVGLSGNFVGPWKTVININYGYAVASDIPDLEGEQEFLIAVFKLF